MPILLKRRDGSITPFRNVQFIPAYYYIPKSILYKCGAELNSIPRNPSKLIRDYNAIAIVESDLFLLAIIDAYAFMVWPFMGLGAKREIYSGYEPAWIYAHATPCWVYEMQEEGIIPTPEKLLKEGGVNLNFGYVSEVEISDAFSWLVPQAMKRHHMNEVIAVAEEFRCFEDFDYRDSTQKIDFHRKWYHSRTKHEQISLQGFQADYAASHNGQAWDEPDDNQDVELHTTSQVFVDEFMATLSEKDKQILELRLEGRTLEDIAKELGYQTHSAVLKRIRKIGLSFEKYSGEDFEFTKNKIV